MDGPLIGGEAPCVGPGGVWGGDFFLGGRVRAGEFMVLGNQLPSESGEGRGGSIGNAV